MASTSSPVKNQDHSTFIQVLPLFLVTILLFCLYLVWIVNRPPNVFWSLDEGGKYIYLESVIRTGRINTPLVYPGIEIDPNFEFVPLYYFIKRGNQIYSWWPSGFPLLSLPFYKLFGWIGLYIIPSLGGSLSALITGLITHKITNNQSYSILSTIITGITTPIAFYSTTYWEHTLSVALVLGVLAVLLLSIENQNNLAFFSGILASLAIFFRIETISILIGFGLVVLLFKKWKTALIYGASTVITSIPWFYFNQWTSRHLLGSTMIAVENAPIFPALNQVGKKILAYILFNPDRADTFVLSRTIITAVSLLVVLGITCALVSRLHWISIICFSILVTICAWVLFQKSEYQAVHGFVLVSPLVLLASFLPSSKKAWKSTPFTSFFTVGSISFAFFYLIKAWVAAGGLQWGPRYLLSLFPLFVIAGLLYFYYIAPEHSPWLQKAYLTLFIFSCLIGLGFEVRGLFTARKLMNFYSRSSTNFSQFQDQIILIDCLGYSMNIPELYWKGTVFSYAYQVEKKERWKILLDEIGISRYQDIQIQYCDNAPLELIEQRFKNNPSGFIYQEVTLK